MEDGHERMWYSELANQSDRRRRCRQSRQAQLAVAFTMPTGATLVFSHGQSRENNSWASASVPNVGAAAATRGTRRNRRGGREEGRDFRGGTVPATR